MESLKIVAFGLFAAVAYGVIHDQVTARICVEYFTIGHPPLIPTTSPTLLALAWGVVATWWVGLPLGAILAVAARGGRRPKLSAAQTRPYVLYLLAVVGALAFISGLLAYVLATAGKISLPQDWANLLPAPTRIPFLVDLWTHSASYLFGVFGSVVVSALVYRRRRSPLRPTSDAIDQHRNYERPSDASGARLP